MSNTKNCSRCGYTLNERTVGNCTQSDCEHKRAGADDLIADIDLDDAARSAMNVISDILND